MRRLLPVLLLSLSVLLPSAVAQTPQGPQPQGPQGVGVVPAPGSPYASPSGSFVELGTVTPGREVTGEGLLRNQGDAPRTVLVFSADATPSRGGGFGFSDLQAADTEVGRWLTLDRDRVTVPARGEVRFRYRLRVPVGTEGGEYVGGVVAQTAEEPTGAGVQTLTRVAMSVYLLVPGGAPGATPGRGRAAGRLVLVAVKTRDDGGSTCPVVRYRNESQLILDPTAVVSTRGALGGSSRRTTKIGAVLPGSQADVRLGCVDRPLGPSTTRVRLTTAQGPLDYTERGLYLPVALVLALLLLLVLVLGVVTTALRGRRVARSTGPSAEAA